MTSLHDDSSTSDAMRRAFEGRDAAAWNRVIEHLSPLLEAQARLRMPQALARHCDPLDIVHDVWLHAIADLPRVEARTGRLSTAVLAYLGRAVFNQTIDRMRMENRRALDQTLTGADPDHCVALRDDPVSAAMHRDRAQQVRTALDNLPRDWRNVLVLRYLEGLTVAQAAEELRLSRENVEKIGYRARKWMAERLPGFGEEGEATHAG